MFEKRIRPEFECQYQKEITCPHCGYKHQDSWEVAPEDDSAEMVCHECKKEFHVEISREVDYTSTCGTKRSDHDWKHNPSEAHPDYWSCGRCGDYYFTRHYGGRSPLEIKDDE